MNHWINFKVALFEGSVNPLLQKMMIPMKSKKGKINNTAYWQFQASAVLFTYTFNPKESKVLTI